MPSSKNSIDHIETVRILVDAGQQPVRLDKFVTDKLPKVSRNRVQNDIKNGRIRVDGLSVKANHKLTPGQLVTIDIPRYRPEEEPTVIPQEIPLDIRYEDDDVMVIYKPPGMVVHPAVGHHDGTLVNALSFHLKQDDLPVLPGNDDSRVGLVHRIDKDTSGLLIIAKTEDAMTHLARQFYEHTIERTYQAICWGEPDPPNGTIDAHLGRDPKNRQNYRVFEEPEDGHKHAVTHYTTLEGLYYVSLIELKLETGRTHQIRVHFRYIGHPLFNDARYGGNRIVKGTIYSKYRIFAERCFEICPRQALHAKSLAFTHPTTGERLSFDSDLPDDMREVLEKWRNYVSPRRQNDQLE
ncbi:RluA family pseudouridine synthase [Neolewinella lacunae]|uniref:Pseudouridine synthase n=1 Tax=Neolewinella lacunae TaxID=1517758 RepID=A0A923PQ48_9BACT|nr:RluA family pseudouridine synthase [Neolewinella lacunae]MBC6994687.1 RluA family pseudouridine synthase [Neolewinella lacunae]MDN3634559.1 RluA family pseudouridine synthase [Neolewinella lacunae]